MKKVRIMMTVRYVIHECVFYIMSVYLYIHIYDVYTLYIYGINI